MVKANILVVEDDNLMRRLLVYRLEKIYHVRSATNGQEALSLIDEEVPDLIISDVMMPVMDGLQLLGALQERSSPCSSIPFIFLTAKADEKSCQEGQLAGAREYITKPFDHAFLLERISQLLV